LEQIVKKLSDFIQIKAFEEAICFPIDRYFLEPYVGEILSLNSVDFIIYNLENVNNTYTVQLFLCLPELWEELTLLDIEKVLNSLTNDFSYYGFIVFTYKYLQINIIDFILSMDTISTSIKNSIKDYLKNQYPNLLQQEGEVFSIDEDIIGIKKEQYDYIKQKLLVREGLEPALQSIENLKKYVNIL
jgi:hypothetical protein